MYFYRCSCQPQHVRCWLCDIKPQRIIGEVSRERIENENRIKFEFVLRFFDSIHRLLAIGVVVKSTKVCDQGALSRKYPKTNLWGLKIDRFSQWRMTMDEVVCVHKKREWRNFHSKNDKSMKRFIHMKEKPAVCWSKVKVIRYWCWEYVHYSRVLLTFQFSLFSR